MIDPTTKIMCGVGSVHHRATYLKVNMWLLVLIRCLNLSSVCLCVDLIMDIKRHVLKS